MGLFVLALPTLLLGNRTRQHSRSDDPEKAAPTPDDQYCDHASNDVLTTNTPHHRIRRVYSFSQPIHTNISSDDLPLPSPSLFARFKAYVWPSNDKLTDLDSFVPNYRWTPIISGVVIPFSILLEIPGLTERWYIRTENNKVVERQSNPVILDLGLAFSFTCALIANVALVLRFLEKRVQTVTLVCIVSLTFHDIINIIAVTIFGVEHRFNDGFTYGEAFWMTLCSTIASTITNISLIIDFARTPDFAKRGSGLTRKQRALMIIVIALLVYLAFGALINSIVLHLSFIDGLYFAVVSIETIGFGDILPRTTGARVWTCLYIAVGVINIGVAIAMCRETILEGLEIGYRRRVRDMRERRREARWLRRWEARWQRAVEFRLSEANLPRWVPDQNSDDRLGPTFLPALKLPFFKRVGTTIKRTATMTSMESVFSSHHRHHLNVEALSPAQLEEAALEAGVPLELFLDLSDNRDSRHPLDPDGLPVQSRDEMTHPSHALNGTSNCWPLHPQTPTHAQLGRMAALLTKFAVAASGAPIQMPGSQQDGANGSNDDVNGTLEQPYPHAERILRDDVAKNHRVSSYLDLKSHPAAKYLKDFLRAPSGAPRSAWSYEKLRAEMEAEERKAYYVKLTIAWLLFFIFWTVGSGIFCVTEGWSYGTAMYFCFVAFSTTGYGDFSPQTPAGRSVFVVWALFGVGTLTILASVLQEAGSSRYKNALHSRVFDKAVKKYRKKQIQESRQRPRPILNANSHTHSDKSHPHTNGQTHTDKSHSHTHGSTSNGYKYNASHAESESRPIAEQLQESQEVAQCELEALPSEILRNARTFHDCMRFFVTGNHTTGNSPFDDREAEHTEPQTGKMRLPPDMKSLLDELGEMEGISDNVKMEILQDEDAKKTLFMLSLERSLAHLVASAEKALTSLAERDTVANAAAAQKQVSQHQPQLSTLPLASGPFDAAWSERDGRKERDVRKEGASNERAHSEPPYSRHRQIRHASFTTPPRSRSTSRARAATAPGRSPHPRFAAVPPRDVAEDESSTSSTYAADV